MKRVWAIALLTFREGLRMRVVLVFLIVLVFLVLRMPFALRGDETLAGRLQNFLAYSLGALSVLLSLATVFFSCATLSNEIRERSLHLVVTKPVTRFQILLGKWVGVNLLNVLIVVLCGGAIYGLAYFIQSRPEQFKRDRYKVRDVVWTARAAARPMPPMKDMVEAAKATVRQKLASGEIVAARERAALGEEIDKLMSRWRSVERGDWQVYDFEDLTPPVTPDAAIQVRFKIIGLPMPPDEQVTAEWFFIDPQTRAPLCPPIRTQERSADVHQFLVKAAPVIRNGRAALVVGNPLNPLYRTALVFDGDKGLQILYRVGSFEMNFVRAVLIIVMRLALLSAIGVFFSVFVSFPVACLCTGSFYLLCLGMPFWLESVGANDASLTASVDPYGSWGPAVRLFLVPLMRVAFPNFGVFDGTGALVDGEFIPYGLLWRAFLHLILYGGLLLFLPGWLIFRQREVAEVTV